MPVGSQTRQLLRWYPRIYFACHARHRRDPETSKAISAHQGSILDHLDALDGTAAGDLAAHMGVTAGTMSIHLHRLEGKGLIARRADPADGRRVLVTLTPAGVRMKAAASVLDADRVEALLAELSPAARRDALAGLRLLAEAAGRVVRPSPFGEAALT